MTHPTQLPWLRAAAAAVLVGSMVGACALDVRDEAPAPTESPAALSAPFALERLRPTAIRAGRVDALRALTSTIEEWYRPHPAGIEHGFTLAELPEGRGEVVVEVGFEEGLRPTLDPTGNVVLRDADGHRVGHYANLHAFDSDERGLPSWMSVEDDRVLLHVDDREAHYPVTIDPLVWGNGFPLVPSDIAPGDGIWDIDIDGNTAVTTSLSHQHVAGSSGALYVFVHNNGTWTEQAELWPGYGYKVALEGDTLAACSGSELQVFERNGTTWALSAWFSSAVPVFCFDMDMEGDVIAVGAPPDPTVFGSSGSVSLYRRLGSSWSEAQVVLNPVPDPNLMFGWSVALEGNVLLVGEPHAPGTLPNKNGRVRILSAPTPTAWDQPLADMGVLEPPLTATSLMMGDFFGSSLAFDEGRLLVAAADYSNPQTSWLDGVVFAYRDLLGILTPTGLVPNPGFDEFGQDLAVSASRAFVSHSGIASPVPYELDQGSWVTMPPLPPPLTEGRRVGLSGNRAVTRHSGAAYVWELNGSLGDPCTSADECLSGECVDGVCCDTSCSGACQSCVLPNTYGQCTPLAMGEAGDPICTPYVCDGTADTCPAQCAADTDCVADHFCDANVCTPKGALADPCTASNGCLSSLCVDGLCCATSCDGPCEACDVTGHEGGCWPLPTASDPADECVEGACNGAGLCASDLGVACASATDCLSGSCVDGLCCNEACDDGCEACDLSGSEGTCTPLPAGSDPADECAAGACDGAGSCKLDLGQACDHDGACLSGFCADGVCCDAACGDDDADCQACSVASGAATDGTCAPLAAGTVCREADGVCGGEESCDGVSPTCPTDLAAPDGTSCDDDDACTAGDSCQSGKCEGGEDVCSEPEGGGSAEGGAGTGGEGGAGSFVPPDGGCGCRTAPSPARHAAWWPLLALGLLIRRRGSSAPRPTGVSPSRCCASVRWPRARRRGRVPGLRRPS